MQPAFPGRGVQSSLKKDLDRFLARPCATCSRWDTQAQREVLQLGGVSTAVVELSRGHRRGQLRLLFQEVASTIAVNSY